MLTSLSVAPDRYPVIEMPLDLLFLALRGDFGALRVVTCFSAELVICPFFVCLS
jgi:hypothetical protein